MQKEDQERLQHENKKVNRKQKLIYDLEVDSKIRKIQKQQIREKAKQDKERIELGENILAQILGKHAPNP